MHLKSISLSKLFHQELVKFVKDLISVMDSYNLRALHLENSYEMLVRHYPEVKMLAREFGPCPVAQKLRAIHTKRMEYAGFVFTHTLSIARLKGEEMKKETHKAQLVVQLHLKGIRKDSRKIANARLWGFFNAIDKDSNAREAFQALNLLSYVEELREIDKQYIEVSKLNMLAKVERSKRKENKAIRKKAETILRTLFSQLQLAQATYPELREEYAALYADLNQMIPKYTKLIRTRATLNKKRAAAKAKAKAEAESVTHILCVDGKQTGTVVIGKEKPIEKKGVKKKKRVVASHKKAKQGAKKTVVATKGKNLGVKKDTYPPQNKTVERKTVNAIKSADITRTKTDFILNGGQVKRKNDFDDGP